MHGSCLCGAITFRVTVPATGVSCCHCSQCRKQSGHVWSSAYVPDAALEISGDPRWFPSSKKARRGFCAECGSFLFWKHDDDSHTSFAMGALDGPTGMTLEKHIFTAEKGDYYDISDGVPCT